MKKRTVILLCAALLLAAVLLAVNLPKTRPPAGGAVGEAPADFSVECLSGETFTLSEHRGRTVVLNFWATWCAPCIAELPSFDLLRAARPDVAVLALHAGPVTEDVAAFCEKLGLGLAFAVAPEALADAFGGADVLPKTVVIAPNGTVTYNAAGAVAFERLLEIVDQAE